MTAVGFVYVQGRHAAKVVYIVCTRSIGLLTANSREKQNVRGVHADPERPPRVTVWFTKKKTAFNYALSRALPPESTAAAKDKQPVDAHLIVSSVTPE